MQASDTVKYNSQSLKLVAEWLKVDSADLMGKGNEFQSLGPRTEKALIPLDFKLFWKVFGTAGRRIQALLQESRGGTNLKYKMGKVLEKQRLKS